MTTGKTGKDIHNNLRLQHVERWAEFIKHHSTPEWSSLQADLINSQIENAHYMNLSSLQVREIKNQKKVLSLPPESATI